MSSMFSLGGAFSKPKAEAVQYWKDFENYFYPVANQWRKSLKDDNAMWEQAKTGILGNTEEAKKNAAIYGDYIKGLFGKDANSFADYKGVGDYLYGKLNDYTGVLKDAGLKDMNLRLAGMGITPGTTGYDRLLNATRITSNMLPAFNNTTNAIGRDYSTISNNDYRDMAVKLGLAQNDALTQVANNPYYTILDLARGRQQDHAARAGMLNGLVTPWKNNTAGFQIKETSDLAKGIGVVDNLLNGVVDLYSSMYGGGMGGGGAGSYNSPALQGGFNLGQQGGQGVGQSNQMTGIIQFLQQLMSARQQPTTGSIPDSGNSAYGNLSVNPNIYPNF